MRLRSSTPVVADTPGRCRASARGALAVAAALLACIGASAHGRPRARDPELHYRLTFEEAQQRVMRVALEIRPRPGSTELVMSRSSPGRYALHEFAKNVFDVQARDGSGHPVALDHVAPNRWIAPPHEGSLHVAYRVYGDRVDGTYLGVDGTHAHVNVPAALLWVRGLEWQPVTVVIVPPAASGWRVATQLFATDDPFTFTAPNLAYLVDSPIEASRHAFSTFRAPPLANGATPGPVFALALHGSGEDSVQVYAASLRRIVAEEAAIFGEYPVFDSGRYTFLADRLPWASGDGMEHRNSTVLTSSAPLDREPSLLLDTAAHEFFHAWNVERIRPRSLEPFDLESANMSGELWLAEGVTTYYEKLVMQRAGFASLAQTLQEWTAMLNQVVTSPARRFRSAEDMSRMATVVDGPPPLDRTNWNYSYISYYVQGAALGLALDLGLREHTAGRQSLDDFMRVMWNRHGRPDGTPIGTVAAPYTFDDVRARLAEVAGDSAFGDAFMSRYVQGRDLPDYGQLLAQAGLALQKAAPGRASIGPLPLERRGSRVRIAAPVAPGTPLGDAGLAEDDEILGIEGREGAGVELLEREVQGLAPGSLVSLRVLPRGATTPRVVQVTLAESPWIRIVPVESLGETLTPEQRAFRDRWLGSRVGR